MAASAKPEELLEKEDIVCVRKSKGRRSRLDLVVDVDVLVNFVGWMVKKLWNRLRTRLLYHFSSSKHIQALRQLLRQAALIDLHTHFLTRYKRRTADEPSVTPLAKEKRQTGQLCGEQGCGP